MVRQHWMAAAGVLVLLGPSAAWGSAERTIAVEPNPVAIGSFFHGTTVSVRGTVDPAASVFVVITGQTIEEHFNRKGRIGPLWATVGKVAISGVPRLHLVASDRPAAAFLARETIDRHLLDVEAIARRADIDAPAADRELLGREYIKLKRAAGVLGSFEDAVQYDRAVTSATFTALIPLPDAIAPGDYQVLAVEVAGGAVVGQQSARLTVEYAGLPRLVGRAALDRSLLYGIFAVVIAVGVGFVMGLVFKRGAGGH